MLPHARERLTTTALLATLAIAPAIAQGPPPLVKAVAGDLDALRRDLDTLAADGLDTALVAGWLASFELGEAAWVDRARPVTLVLRRDVDELGLVLLLPLGDAGSARKTLAKHGDDVAFRFDRSYAALATDDLLVATLDLDAAFELAAVPLVELVALVDATPQGTVARPLSAGKDGVSNPTRVFNVRAEYPVLARQYPANGRVVLAAVIDAEGRVRSIELLEAEVESLTRRPPPPGWEEKAREAFIASARQAVRQWRYEPAQKDGRPVAVYFTITVEWTLNAGG